MGAFSLVRSGVEGLGEGCVWCLGKTQSFSPKHVKKKWALCLGGCVESSP